MQHRIGEVRSDREEKRQKFVTALAPSVGYRGQRPHSDQHQKATAVNQCARWCGGTEHPAHIVKRKRSETKRPIQTKKHKSKKSLQPIKRYFFVVPPTPKGAACFPFDFQGLAQFFLRAQPSKKPMLCLQHGMLYAYQHL